MVGESMKHEIDLKKYTIRTDLIVDLLGEIEDNEGVEVRRTSRNDVCRNYQRRECPP